MEFLSFLRTWTTFLAKWAHLLNISRIQTCSSFHSPKHQPSPHTNPKPPTTTPNIQGKPSSYVILYLPPQKQQTMMNKPFVLPTSPTIFTSSLHFLFQTLSNRPSPNIPPPTTTFHYVTAPKLQSVPNIQPNINPFNAPRRRPQDNPISPPISPTPISYYMPDQSTLTTMTFESTPITKPLPSH